MKNETKKSKDITAEELINEGLGNKEKLQDEMMRKEIDGDIIEEGIETIEKLKKTGN